MCCAAACYEEGSTGSMAEEDVVYELENLENQLRILLSRYCSDDLRVDCKPFCSDFCKVVEQFATRWQVPLPQLRILKIALCFFAQASPAFTLNCDIVHQTISSLALSVFELLLFFDQKDWHQEPLKQFTVAFQECNLALARHQNVHLLQVDHLICVGGPWACPVLQAILSESSLPQNEVDGFISSELPVLFELRVRYLLSCERISEAMALAKCCAWHPTAGQHLFFLQVYLSWLLKTSQHDILRKEVAGLNGKDAVHIICSLEYEEQDELLLALSRVFLSQQLCRGDMHSLCDLVLIWSKLHHRLKTPNKVLLEEIRLLMQSATNVNSIFPFIRAILQEAGEDGIPFCVELCANGLQFCLPCDVITKSLIYKTIASLLPNDLEVCRACALLVFFLERTVEAYKTAYLLYMHSDQDYHVDHSPIRNHIRFEMLQILKKDMYFDPEFWNLIALRTNCLKLLSKEVVSSALEEIMEDKWILKYSTKETTPPSRKSVCRKGNKGVRPTQKRSCKGDRLKEDLTSPSKRLRLGPGKTLFNVDHTVKRKNNQASRTGKGRTSEPLRRSFWQLDRLKDSRGYEDRRITRLSEKNPPKRRIRTPRWLLEDSGTLEKKKSKRKIKKHRLKHQKHHEVSPEKVTEAIQIKNNAKQKPYPNPESLTREANGKHQKGLSVDSLRPASPPQMILELSLPDNELFGTFSEDTCYRQRGLPQVLFYKHTMKHATTTQPVKTVHRKEVILRTRDLTMFVQQLHCYTRRLKGKGSGTSVQASVSKITRSSVQGMPSKAPEKSRSGDTAPEDKDVFASSLPTAEEAMECSVVEKAQTIQTGSQKSSPGRERCKRRGADDLQSQSEVLDNVPQDASTDHILQTRSSKHREEVATQLKVSSVLQGAAENKLPEAPVLEKGRHVQTKEPCEESAVEMKVTFASQTAAAGKLLDSSVSDKVSISSSADVSAVSRGLAEESSLINTAGAIPMATRSHHSVLLDEKRLERSSLSSQISPGCPEVDTKVNNSISSTVTSSKLSDGHSAFTNYARAQGKGFNATPPGSDGINDLSDFPGMVSAQMAPDGSKDFTHDKSHTTSSCSLSEQRISADDDSQWRNEDLDDFDAESTMNAEPVESEESRLEFCCTFCKKVFNGSRVVAHAMFHFRKDECMFCGTMFKDDLLAMMHLSDHIEKLKKSKELAGSNIHEKQLCDTKDDSIPNSSTKANTADIAAVNRRRGRPRKTAITPKSVTHETRKLRSSVETRVAPCLQEEQEDEFKNLNVGTSGHKMNGNVAKNTVLERLKMVILNSKAKQPRIQKIVRKGDGGKKPQESLESSDRKKVTEKRHVPKATSKHNGRVQEKNTEPQQTVVCPVEGCTWALDLSKNRVALLYHALEDHDGDISPLKLAFCIGNGKCSICMRVLWSFEHFQHHVERHRLAPRHPCLHQGCTARFKTGMEMRRHTRKHSPLQAVCCLPGCSELFICLWALNLHEREHYSSKSTKPDKNPNGQKCNVPSEKDQRDSGMGDGAAVDETVCGKAPRQSRAEPVSKLTDTHKMEESVPKRDVLKNLSNKETSKQPAGPNLRLRRETKAHIMSQKYRALLKNTCSAFLKRKLKARHKFKRQLKMRKIRTRRELPPKLKDGEKMLKDKPGESSSEPKKSVNRKFKNPIKQNGVLHSSSVPVERKPLKLSSRLSRSKRQNVESTQPALGVSEEGNVKDQAEKKDSTHNLCHELLSTAASGEQSQKLPAAESKKFTKKRSKKIGQNVAELKKNNKRNASNQTDGGKTSLKRAKLSLEDQHVEDKADKEDGIQRETFNPRSEHCGTSVTALPASSSKAMVPPSPATEETRKEATHLEESASCVGNSDSKKANKKHNVTSDGETKSAAEKDGDAQEMVSEGSGVQGALSSQVLPPGAKPQSVKVNGQVALGSNSSVCIETLAEYGKKPYMRPPPTAYLDEKYTTMPKRRKEMTTSHSERIAAPKEVRAGLQRQRCANCFATFSSTDELQVHLLLQKCSNLFGFDSDDEGNS